MPKTILKRVLASGLALLFAMGSTLIPSQTLAASSTSSGAQISQIGAKAFEDLATCLASYQKPVLDVFYLVDNSGSLSYTDPKYVRSDVLGTSISELKSFKSEGVEVNYSATLFGSDLERVQPWTKLTDDSDFEQASQLLTKKIYKNYGGYTDWQQGLVFANQQLNAQPSNHCKMLIWFTDGGVNPTGDPQDALDSLRALCNAGITETSLGTAQGPFGVFAKIRQDGISIFGVLYQNDASTLKEYERDYSAKDAQARLESEHNRMEFMAPLVEGVGVISTADPFGNFPGPGRVQCGDIDEAGFSPVGQPNGAFVRAQDPVDLAFQFLSMQAVLSGGSGQQIINDGFTVPPGTAAFKILTTGSTWKLTGPDGSKIEATQANNPNSNKSVSVSSTAGVHEITVEVLGKKPLLGDWKIVAGGVQSSLYLYSGLGIELDRDQTSQIVGDRDNSLTGQIIRRNEFREMPLDLSVYSTSEMRLSHDDGTGNLVSFPGAKLTLEKDGQFKAERIRPDASSKKLDLWVSLDLGKEFSPVTANFEVLVVPRSDIASAKTNIIQLTDLDGPKGIASGKIEIVGPTAQPESEYCLAAQATRTDDLQTAAQKHPRSNDFVWKFNGKTANDSPFCITVARGKTSTILVEVSNPIQADSKVVSVRNSTSKSAGAGLTESVQFEFKSKAKVDQSVAFWVDAILLLLGILLPLGLLYLMNWLTTNFLPLEQTVLAEYPVEILSGGSRKIVGTDGQSITVGANDFKFIQDGPSAKSMPIKTHGTAEAKMAWFPLLPSWFQQVASPGHRVVSLYSESGKNSNYFSDGNATEISPNHAANWFVSIPESELRKPTSENMSGVLIVASRMSNLPNYQARVTEIAQKPGLYERIEGIRQAVQSGESNTSRKSRKASSKGQSENQLETKRRDVGKPLSEIPGIPGVSQSEGSSSGITNVPGIPGVQPSGSNSSIPGVQGIVPGATPPKQ